MNETSNMNSTSSTGGVCSSCLKEMPMAMPLSSTNPSSMLCSNCLTEYVDQQQFTSDLSKKFPLLPSVSSVQQQQQQHHSSIFPPHFSSPSSSSASSTSSSISSTNRRFSVFDPFTSGSSSNSQYPFLPPMTDYNPTLSLSTPTSSTNIFETHTTPSTPNDFVHYFHQFLQGTHPSTSDRDSPSSSIHSNDISQSILPHAHGMYPSSSSSMDLAPLNRPGPNDLPSSFCCFANNRPYAYCLDCETSLCEQCALVHPKILGFKNHRQQLLSSQTQPTPRSVIGQSIRPAHDPLSSGTGSDVHLSPY